MIGLGTELLPLFFPWIGESVPPMARAKYDAALAIARACPRDMAIEIREMAGYARANHARWWSTFFATSSAGSAPC